MTEDALYYKFEFTAGNRHDYGGIWHYAKVTRVTPDAELLIDRVAYATRWGAKRGAKRIAKADLAWLKARSQDETQGVATVSERSWLWDELERAAEQYAEIPEYLRPVITAPGALVK